MRDIWMVLQQTAAVSIVALFVLLLQRLFRDKLSPKWQYTIWLVLLCRLVVPVGWGAGTRLDVSGWLDTLRVWGELKLDSAWAGPWTASIPGAAVPLPPAGGGPRSVTDWLFVAYLVGAAVCAAWLALGWLRLRRMVHQAVPVAGARLEEIHTLADKFGLKASARVVESLSAHGPFLMGVFRPTLVVPMGWQVEETVILHELLHRKNQDVAAGWVTALFRCVHWCNPFLWWVFDRIDNQREERCDQQVLERLSGEERRDYGRVLLSMAEDQVIRVPGATSMANGAKRIKQRIQSIARFKTFPKGMGLVSVCMTLILIPNLVVGFPALAAGEEDVSIHSEAQVLAYAQRNSCTTVAGALNAYANWMYYRVQSPLEALLARAMSAAEEDMPAILEEYEANWERWGVGTSRHEELDAAYRTGPLFRGLSRLEENRWVCQVYMFRDSMGEGIWDASWPVDYLCHTVEIRKDETGAHTVTLLAEAKGEMPGDTSLSWGEMLEAPPVIWTGSAAGVDVTVYPEQSLQIQGGWVNGMTRNMWNFLNPDWPRGGTPDPDARFSACYGRSFLTVTNDNEEKVDVRLDVNPEWEAEGMDSARNFTANPARFDGTLKAGEVLTWDGSGGGAEHYNGIDLEECLCPDRFTATLAVDGVEYPLTLEREVTWE